MNDEAESCAHDEDGMKIGGGIGRGAAGAEDEDEAATEVESADGIEAAKVPRESGVGGPRDPRRGPPAAAASESARARPVA